MPAPRKVIPRVAPLAHSEELLAIRLAYFRRAFPLPARTPLGRSEAFKLEFSIHPERRRDAWAAVRLKLKGKVPAARFAALEAEYGAAGEARDFSFWSDTDG